MKKITLLIASVLFLFQCSENELLIPKAGQQSTTTQTQTVTQTLALSVGTYYVSPTGNDAWVGSASNPYKTIKFAISKVPAGQNYTLQLSAGTFVETGMIAVPTGVNIVGAGTTQTIIKAASPFYYHPASPGYALDKFLISLTSSAQSVGNQVLTNFSIDGDTKQLHGGIYIKFRDNVIIDGVKVQNTNFTGIWLWDVRDSKITKSQLVNCSWGSSSYSSGALNLGNITRVEIDQLDVNESTGYGIKAIGPGGNNNILNSKIHDSHISVNPVGLWNSGSAPNIAIELWSVNLVGNEIYNTYVDNTISLINSNAIPSTGVQTIRVHHNTIDMDTRAHGAGYGIELTIHDTEIDHNYFIKGTQGIANWANAMKNWNIHHNTFYAIQGQYPGEVVRSQSSGLHNVQLYNNTIEFASAKTMNVIGMYGGTSDNVDIRNNLFINNNTGYSYYPNQLIHKENGATLSTLTVINNLFFNLPVGSVPGNYANNLTSDPQINSSGVRPDPYYMPKSSSPLINAGINIGYPFSGTAPDIGALESGGTGNQPPQVSLTSPLNLATLTSGAVITISASATDSDGSITKVEFFNGVNKLGEDLTSPFSLTWTVTAGTSVISARATDNAGAVSNSNTATVIAGSTTAFRLGLDSSDASLSGKMTVGSDSQAQFGNFFYVTPGQGKNYSIPPPAAGVFNFTIPKTGNYVIWAKVKTPASSNQGFNIYNGNGKWFTWSAGIHTSWTWVKITDGGSDALFPFVTGGNQFKMAWLDENAMVDQVVITDDLSYAP